MNDIQRRDIEVFASSFLLSSEIENSKFLITGATGLIGSSLIYCLLALDKNITIIAPVRNKAKAEQMLEEYAAKIKLVECDIVSFDYTSLGDVDYIIHCAAPTSSKFFVEKPVETFNIIVEGTKVLLDYAKEHKVKGFVYLSSLEVYGEVQDDSSSIKEDFQGYLNPMSVRSSYPMAKRAVENMCCLYSSEYGVPAKVARLTQTTGAGIAKDDNRIIAQFARLTSQGNDIVLHTTGEAARPYCYTTDAISAILYILVKGESGEAYNVANEETYISARGMAEYLREEFNPNISVKIELNDNMGYAPVTKQRLSAQKLRNLGWNPRYGLKEIFNSLIRYLVEY
ncbi:MAG: NAD(P)-dependent oxidoreductase [Paludibacteraceae bacterium]|nr:NAD(P)-dependent oxidoreductase [Paludibacteraceae bacterium]